MRVAVPQTSRTRMVASPTKGIRWARLDMRRLDVTQDMAKKFRVGDVFTVPVDESRISVGQIVGKHTEHGYYFAAFDTFYSRDEPLDIDKAISHRLLFLILSLDAKLFHGDWTVFGNRQVSKDIPLPAYKEEIQSADDVYVVDYTGTKKRPATNEEADLLPFRKFIAPVRLEKALRAKAGLAPWIEAYSEMAPDLVTSTRRLF